VTAADSLYCWCCCFCSSRAMLSPSKASDSTSSSKISRRQTCHSWHCAQHSICMMSPLAALHSDTSVRVCAVKASLCGGCADDMAPCCASLGVVSGDTLDSLASTVGLPPVAISAYNQLQPAAALQPGQLVSIPCGRIIVLVAAAAMGGGSGSSGRNSPPAPPSSGGTQKLVYRERWLQASYPSHPRLAAAVMVRLSSLGTYAGRNAVFRLKQLTLSSHSGTCGISSPYYSLWPWAKTLELKCKPCTSVAAGEQCIVPSGAIISALRFICSHCDCCLRCYKPGHYAQS